MSNCSADLVVNPIDNEDNSTFLSDEELEYWEGILQDSRHNVQRILFPIAMIIGVFGNGITIAVLTRRTMKSSTNLYLTALAASDMLYLTFAFSLSLKHIPGMARSHNWFYWHYYRYALWLVDASSNTSTWLTLAFTIERYIAVCHPIKGKVFCTQSRAKRVIASVFLISFLITITTPHEWVVVYVPVENGTRLAHQSSYLWKNETFKMIFSWMTTVLFFFVPLILLVIFNTLLVLAVKRSRKQRNSLTGSQPTRDHHAFQEYKITIMLISVVLMAIICLMPTAIIMLYTSFNEPRPKTKNFYVTIILNNYFNFLTAVNATTNFIFYCLLSDRYRRTFMKTFCSRWYEQPSPQVSWAMTGYSNFEDGSPYSFQRSSTLRSSHRRSSYRSSGSSSPRNSPSRGPSYRRSSRRHSSKGESFLMVPTFGTMKEKCEILEEVPNHTFEAPNCDQKGSNVVRLGSTADTNELLSKEQKSPETVPFVSIPLSSEAPNPQDDLDERMPSKTRRRGQIHIRRFFALLRARRKNSNRQPHNHKIVITCQKPSFEDQTSV